MSKELDALVAERVMGWPTIGPHDPYREYHHFGGIISDGVPERFRDGSEAGSMPDTWSPFADIAAANNVVDKMRADKYHWWGSCTIAGVKIGFSRTTSLDITTRRGECEAKTLAEAITVAALRAVGVDEATIEKARAS